MSTLVCKRSKDADPKNEGPSEKTVLVMFRPHGIHAPVAPFVYAAAGFLGNCHELAYSLGLRRQLSTS